MKRDSFRIGRSIGPSLIGALLAAALLLTIPAPAFAWDDNPIVVPPDANPFGATYGEWSARWWQWFLMFPQDQGPFNWPTTKDCTTGQLGPVWLLVGLPASPGTVTVTCHVPAGKALFFPVINVECSSLEQDPFHGATAQDRSKCAARDLKGVVALSATIDGSSVNNLKNFFVQSPDFDFAASPNNSGGVPPGFGQSTSVGYYLMLAPLSSGPHTIHFVGEVNNPTIGDFKIDTTYKLTVDRIDGGH
jgi:hypothetical protein